jgi:hypothetical protein
MPDKKSKIPFDFPAHSRSAPPIPALTAAGKITL